MGRHKIKTYHVQFRLSELTSPIEDVLFFEKEIEQGSNEGEIFREALNIARRYKNEVSFYREQMNELISLIETKLPKILLKHNLVPQDFEEKKIVKEIIDELPVKRFEAATSDFNVDNYYEFTDMETEALLSAIR